MTEDSTTGGHSQVEEVIRAYLEYLEGTGPKPTLDQLDDAERRQATELIESLRTGRGIDPYASRPPLEALLAGTPFEGALTPSGAERPLADLATVRDLIAARAPKAHAKIDVTSEDTESVVFDYLDLRVRFLLVDASIPTVTDDVRARVERSLEKDPDTAYVGVVARGDEELPTQLLSATDLGPTLTTPRGDTRSTWLPVLPLEWAALQVLELGAPEWESFEFEAGLAVPLDVAAVATDLARQVIEREAARPYRGDKAVAYRSLAGHEGDFAELVTLVATDGEGAVDLDAGTLRIARDAA